MQLLQRLADHNPVTRPLVGFSECTRGRVDVARARVGKDAAVHAPPAALVFHHVSRGKPPTKTTPRKTAAWRERRLALQVFQIQRCENSGHLLLRLVVGPD